MDLDLKQQPFTLSVTLVDVRKYKSQLAYDLTAQSLDEAMQDAAHIVEHLAKITTAKIESYSVTVQFLNAITAIISQNSNIHNSAQIQVGISPHQRKGGKYRAVTLTIPSPIDGIFTDSSQQRIHTNHHKLNDYVAIFGGTQPKALLRSRKYVATGIKGGYWQSRKSTKK